MGKSFSPNDMQPFVERDGRLYRKLSKKEFVAMYINEKYRKAYEKRISDADNYAFEVMAKNRKRYKTF